MQTIEIIDAGATTTSNTDADTNNVQQQDIENPAANFGKYHEQFGYEQTKPSALRAPDVPEIKVNGVLIDEASVLAEMQHHPADNQRSAMIQSAQSLIIGELLKQQAIALGLLTGDEAINSIEEAAGLQAMLEQEVQVPQASAEECQRFYESNQQHFSTSPLLEVRHILLGAPPEDVTGRMQLTEVAKSLITELQQDLSCFKELVNKHSDCPSKQQQGSLGQISKGQTVAEFEKALLAADSGLIDYPIESRYGVHIAIIDRRVDGQVLPFEFIKDKVEEYLNERVQRKATAQYIHTLISDAKITGFTFDLESSPLIQ
ncbi:peptidylprolyl isomerase [Thalassotalea litorea]|nr:peptidylprolyl isomerase [Thalassotalea litorea]